MMNVSYLGVDNRWQVPAAVIVGHTIGTLPEKPTG